MEENRSVLDDFCTRFCDVLEAHDWRYAVVSGFVAIASGRTRGTEDIDVLVERRPREDFVCLHEALVRAGFSCMQSDDPTRVYEQLAANAPVRYQLGTRWLPHMEVKFARDELDEYQLRTRQKLPQTGLPVWFSSVNMNIAFKEHVLKSPKDMEDAIHLRTVFEDLVDEKEIAHIRTLIRRCKR